MSKLAQIRTAMVATVAAVPGAGVVHAYERYIRGDDKFKQLYLYTPPGGVQQLRGWWLRRVRTAESSPNVSPETRNVHTWHLRAFMALNDEAASELVFEEMVEAVRDALRADPTFGGVADQGPLNDGDNTDGAQVVDVGPVTFCGALCHSALLEMKTWSYV